MARKKTPTSKPDTEQDTAEAIQDVEEQGNDTGEAAAAADEVIDAEIISEDAPDGAGDDENEVGAEAGDASDSASDAEDEDVSEATPAEEDIVTPSETAEGEPPHDPTSPAPVQVETVVERKSGFFPMLLGGLVAGGLGFGAAYLALPQTGGDLDALRSDISAKFDAQSGEIAGLSDTVNALPTGDTSALETELGDVSASMSALSDRLSGVEDTLAALDTRLTDVEKRPMTEGASDAAIAAYERELTALQEAIAAQRSEIENIAAEAMSAEENAEETAQATLRRAAFTRIQSALDAGAGFAPALGDLEAAGITAPAALAAVAEEGAPSLGDLQQSFPDAARAALGVSRQEAAANGEESGFSAFLKNQLGTRSLEPREGDDPDAVLSRAEAAVREGRLTDALAEIDALPQVGREALTDWTDQVAQRQAALAAAEALGQELN